MEASRNLYEAQRLQEIQQRAERMRGLETADRLREVGYEAWFVLFALAALLLLAWALWPRRRVLTPGGWRDEHEQGLPPLSMRRDCLGFGGAILLCLACAVSHQRTIDEERGFIHERHRRIQAKIRNATDEARETYLAGLPAGVDEAEAEKGARQAEAAAREEVVQSHYLYLPEGRSLRYLALGNQGLAADYLWLTSLQYVSSPFRQGQKFDMMHRFYSEILELDPRWIEIHVNAGKILSALDPDRRRTELYLNACMTRNPGDYRLPMEAGMLFVVPPADTRQYAQYSAKAAWYLNRALERAQLPRGERLPLEKLIATLEREGGNFLAARDKSLRIVRDPDVPQVLREVAAREFLQAESLVRASVLQDVVDAYKARHGEHLPRDLQQALADARARGDTVPGWWDGAQSGAQFLDAYGYPMVLDAQSGQVAARGEQALRANQTARVIHSLLEQYRAFHAGRNPDDLEKLSGFSRNLFRAQGVPFAVREVLGDEVDATRNPLHEPWDYNKEEGRVIVPELCDPRRLFHNASLVLKGEMPAYFK